MKTPDTIVFDFDGTLIDLDPIRHLFGDWDAFHAASFDCPAREGIVALARRCQTIMRVIVLTGKPERYKAKLLGWLSLRGIIPDEVLMRPDHNIDSDRDLKPQLLDDAGVEKSRVIAIVEDRDKMVDLWRELGYTCLQAAPCIESTFRKEEIDAFRQR